MPRPASPDGRRGRRAWRLSPSPRARLVLLAALVASVAIAPLSRAEDLVSFGKPVVADGRVDGTVVAVGASAVVRGEVTRDVVVIGGDAELEPGSHVAGDVLVAGGVLRVGRGARLDGRRLTLAAAEAAFLSELETSPLAPGAISTVLLGLRLLLLLLWLGLGLLFLRLLPRRVGAAARLVPAGGARAAVVGLTAVLGGLLLSAFGLFAFPSLLGLGVAGTLVAVLGAAKAFGLAAVFVAVGRLLTRRAARGSAFFGDPAALSVGLLFLGAVSLVPVAGPLLWAVASVLGIGLSVVTFWSGGADVPA